jgi:Ribbon-helix-helix protein, copG family
MLRTVGRKRVYPSSERIVAYLPTQDLRHLDVLCKVMNVSRSECIRMLLANVRTTNHKEKA